MKKNKQGFNAIELLVVLSIIALIVVIVLNIFIHVRKNQALVKDTEIIVEVLNEARSLTLSSKDSTNYGVHIASDKVTFFTGGTYSAGNSTNVVYPLNTTDTILTISLSGGGSDVIFNRLTGETSQNGTVVVSSPGISQSKTVTIYKTGVIESQ